MKNIRFAVVAMLVAVALIGCKKSDLDKTILSVSEVTENSISGACTYTPKQENDGGYLIFLSKTNEVTDEMRNAMTAVYGMNRPHHENMSFTFDSLASNRTYYIMAVTYCNKEGKVAIDNIETLAQRTLASNDYRVTYSTEGMIVTVTMMFNHGDYQVCFNDVFDNSHYKCDLMIDYINYPSEVVDSIDEPNCYQDGKIVFSVDFGEMENNSLEEKTFYAFVPSGRDNKYDKYEIFVNMFKALTFGTFK